MNQIIFKEMIISIFFVIFSTIFFAPLAVPAAGGSNDALKDVEGIFVGDIHWDVRDVSGAVHGDITGTVRGSIGAEAKVYGNVKKIEGNAEGTVEGHIGHVRGNLEKDAVVWSVETVDGDIRGTVTGEGPYPGRKDTVTLGHVGGSIGREAKVNVPVGTVEKDVLGTVGGPIQYIGGQIGREATVEGPIERVGGDVDGGVNGSIGYIGGKIGIYANVRGPVKRVQGQVEGHVQGWIEYIQGKMGGMQADPVNKMPNISRSMERPYPGSRTYRFMGDSQMCWDTPLAGYAPQDYTDKSVIDGNSETDTVDPIGCQFNSFDSSGIMRISYHGKYQIDELSGRPLNPQGRTGLRGRGMLARWGPNHVGVPIVTRIDTEGKLQFLAIEREDTGELALPEGFVAPWASPMEAAIRAIKGKLLEGHDGSLGTEIILLLQELENLWAQGRKVYKGWVDDPRNTDNAWVETVAVQFHDKKGMVDMAIRNLNASAMQNVTAGWITVRNNVPNMQPPHRDLINLLAEKSECGDQQGNSLKVRSLVITNSKWRTGTNKFADCCTGSNQSSKEMENSIKFG